MSVSGELERYLEALIAVLRRLEAPTCGALGDELEGLDSGANLSDSARRVVALLAGWDVDLRPGKASPVDVEELRTARRNVTAICEIILGH